MYFKESVFTLQILRCVPLVSLVACVVYFSFKDLINYTYILTTVNTFYKLF